MLRRGRILVGASFGLALVVAVGLAGRLAIAEMHPAVTVLNIVCVLIFLAAPWLLRSTGSLDAAGSAVVAGLFLLVAGPGFLVAGLDAPVLMGAPVLPVVATYLLGVRAGIVQVVLLLTAIALLMAFPYLGVAIPELGLDSDEELRARGLILGLAVAFTALLAWLTELQRVDTQRRFRRSEELYRKTFEQSKDVVALSTPAGDLIDINQAGLEFYGFTSKEQLVGRNIERVYVNLERRRAMLEQLEAVGYVRDFESEHRTRAGELRILEGTTSTIRGEGGDIEMLVTVLHDVTERRRVEEEREEMLAELSAKNAELERFTHAVSHDLKAPITTIRGFLGLLKKDALAGRNDRVEEDYATLDRVARRMAEMIDGLLKLSRIDRQTDSRSQASLSEIAREAVELLAGRISKASAVVELADDLPRVHGDPALLRLIFQNLIDNAVKFSSGPSPPRVRITASRKAEQVTCIVSDNGVGIAPEELERVFELFHQTQPEKEGTGIGLNSVRRAVEALGGQIWAESKGEGQGTRFCFTLTLAGASSQPLVAREQSD